VAVVAIAAPPPKIVRHRDQRDTACVAITDPFGRQQ
jgi:hypothetical protein